jgi:hypothetical protein
MQSTAYTVYFSTILSLAMPAHTDEDELPPIEPVAIGGQRVNVSHYLTKPYDDVSEAAQELPALIEWVNQELQVCTENKLVAAQELAEAEATAYFELRQPGAESFAENYVGKATEEAMKHAVVLDARVKKCGLTAARWSAWASRLYNLQHSLQAKLELVRSSEATRRHADDSGGA